MKKAFLIILLSIVIILLLFLWLKPIPHSETRRKMADGLLDSSIVEAKPSKAFSIKTVQQAVAPPHASLLGVDQNHRTPSPEQMGSIHFGVSDTMANELKLSDEERSAISKRFKEVWSEISIIARLHTKKDESNNDPNKDAYIIEPFPDQGALVKENLLQSLEQLIGAKADFIRKNFLWRNYFGDFGKNKESVQFYSEFKNDNEVIRFNVTTYDGLTGKEKGGGEAEYDDFIAKFGDIFETK